MLELKRNWLGLVFCAFFSALSILICLSDFANSIKLNALTIAVILGVLISNLTPKIVHHSFKAGVLFSSKKVLRLAIILYGFRITFQQIQMIGMQGFFADIIMFSTTYAIGCFIGMKLFKMDHDTAILTSIGSSVCGAAAVLGTDGVLNAKSYKVSVAVATVVLFGTIAMFLYPAIYKLGWLDANTFGIYIGSTVHEVAQVVAAGGAISETVMDTSVIVKLTRVMLLVPYLLLLNIVLARKSEYLDVKIQIPWFVILFVIVSGFNSLDLLALNVKSFLIDFDAFLLTMAMFALGVETNLDKIKGLGLKPFILAAILFVWLICGGMVVSKFIV